MLKDAYILFASSALRIKGFRLGTKEEYDDIQSLANSYVYYEKVQDRTMMESYISALMVRYWYMVPYVYEQSKSLKIERDDIVTWIYEAIVKAFKYKSWLDPTKDVSREPNGAEKVINRCIDSVRQGYFQQSNRDSRKINYITHSIEDSIAMFGDSAEELYVEDESTNYDIKDLILNKIKENKFISALVVDGICFNNCFSKGEFNLTKLISGLDDKYLMDFKKRYNIKNEKFAYLLNDIKTSRKNLNKKVKRELLELKEDKGLLNICCQM